MCEGDVVLVQETGAIRGAWSLAEVVEALPGSDGNVRDVKIRYKPTSADIKYSGVKDIVINRSVHRLVLLLPVEQRNDSS